MAYRKVDEGYLLIKTNIANRPWGFWLLPKVEKIKNSFLLPNELFTLHLCAGEIAVYAFLLSCENRDTYQCYPSYKTIGEAIQMSRGTVKKYVDSLVDKHLIYTEPTQVWGKHGKKRNGNLLYTIRPIADAVAFQVENGLKNLPKTRA
jgi:predicted transcriptional regulator